MKLNSDVINNLRHYYSERSELLGRLKGKYESSIPVLSSILIDPNDFTQLATIESLEKKLRDIDSQIAHLIRYEHLSPLKHSLEKFQKHHADPNKTAFVMMKFPDGKNAGNDKVLAAIYRTVQHTCKDEFGITAVRADGLSVGKTIWDNAQVHMLGCNYGIAILENKHSNGFNPNISMEAGYVAGIGHELMLLVEKDFPPIWADFQGTIQHPFVWGDSDENLDSIRKAVVHGFSSLGLPRQQR